MDTAWIDHTSEGDDVGSSICWSHEGGTSYCVAESDVSRNLFLSLFFCFFVSEGVDGIRVEKGWIISQWFDGFDRVEERLINSSLFHVFFARSKGGGLFGHDHTGFSFLNERMDSSAIIPWLFSGLWHARRVWGGERTSYQGGTLCTKRSRDPYSEKHGKRVGTRRGRHCLSLMQTD